MEAVASFRAALALYPDHLESLVDLGNILLDQHLGGEALVCFERASALRPDIVELKLNHGLALEAAGRGNEAIAVYDKALSRLPDNPQLHNNAAMALRSAGKLEEAIERFDSAIRLDPRATAPRDGLVDTLLACGRLDEALQACEAALALLPRSGILHNRLGHVHLRLGKVGAALDNFRQALALEPGLLDAHSALLLTQLYSDAVSDAQVEQDLRRYARTLTMVIGPARSNHNNSRDAERRVKIGYVSADFYTNSVAYFIEPVIAGHDRSRFEVYCYYTAGRSDAVTQRLRACADHWREAKLLSDSQLAEQICSDGIDILVDLSGHTSGHRLATFARKPAPVQISWIGYPCDTGLQQIDYRLTDQRASPECKQGAAQAAPGRAALLCLPRVFSCYRPPGDAPEPFDVAWEPGETVTLGSFNNAAKISDSILQLWAKLLRARPQFRLLLKDKAYSSVAGHSAILERLAREGVSPDRVQLHSRLPSGIEHLCLYRRVDICLDTFPYCGVTTTCEALWMGVPVVSLAGERFVSRMGATILPAVGHPEWVAHDEAGYEQCVLALADDPALRTQLRRDLRTQMRASALMDEAGHLLALEDALLVIWRRWCAAANAPSEMKT